MQEDRLKRYHRIMSTQGMPLHTIIAKGLIQREDWRDFGGAQYPMNGHWWGRKKNGKPRYIGPVRHAEKKYIPVANSG